MILNTLIHTFLNTFTTYLHDLISVLLRSYDLVLSLCDAQTVPGLAGTPQTDSFAPSPSCFVFHLHICSQQCGICLIIPKVLLSSLLPETSLPSPGSPAPSPAQALMPHCGLPAVPACTLFWGPWALTLHARLPLPLPCTDTSWSRPSCCGSPTTDAGTALSCSALWLMD